MAGGNKIEVAQAFVTIVPSMAGSQAEISRELTGVTNEAAETAGEESGSKFGSSFAGALKAAGATIGAAMAAATGAAIATGKAFVDTANDVAAYGDNVDKMSQKMNISARAYQEWDFVMQHAGASIDSLKGSMKTLATAAETGNAAFEALGLSQEQVASMSQEDLFSATIAGLQNISDETERTYLASQLLGKGATELGALFNMSASETEALKQQVNDLGGIMSDEAVKDAANYADQMTNVQTALDGMKRNLMVEFLPGMADVMSGLAKLFSGDEGGVGEIQSGLEDVINNVTKLAPQFFSLAETLIMSLLSGFGPMLPQLASTIFNVINQAIVTLVTMLPQLMPAITSGIQSILTSLFQCLPIITQSLLTLISDLVTWLSTGDNVTMFINGIVDLVAMIADQIAVVLPVLLPAIVKIISDVALALTSPDNIEKIVGAALTILGAVIVALINAVPELINFVIGTLDNLGGLVAKFLSFIVPIVAEGILNVANTVKDWGNNIKQFITNLIDGIRNGISNWINNLKTNFTTAFNFIKDSVSNIVDKIKSLVENIISKIKELPEKVVSIGRDLVEGLWNGVNDKISWVKDKISGMGESITSAIKGVFGIASPSKIWRDQVGSMLALGIGEGFTEEMEDVKTDMAASMNDLTGSMSAEVNAYGASAAETIQGPTTNYNGGSITLNIYGAEGQNVNDLAEQIAKKLEDMTRRKGVVYA